MKPTNRRSWAGNLLMFSDLTFGLSFKVKRWFTGFGELSFRWIQICIDSPMRRSTSLLIGKKIITIDWEKTLLIGKDSTFSISIKCLKFKAVASKSATNIFKISMHFMTT